MNTRDKILTESRSYLNEHGYGATSLYQVSQRLGMSRGNLTYHFKDKEALLEVLLDELKAEHNKALMDSIRVPSWQSLQKATDDFHRLQKDYAFIFFDKSVLFLPKVQKLVKNLRDENIRTQMSMISISIQTGNMHAEPFKGAYHNLSRTIWMLTYFWLVSKLFKDKEDVSWDKMVWSLMLPHFTEKGLASFEKHFGGEYLADLGAAYGDYVDGVMEF